MHYTCNETEEEHNKLVRTLLLFCHEGTHVTNKTCVENGIQLRRVLCRALRNFATHPITVDSLQTFAQSVDRGTALTQFEAHKILLKLHTMQPEIPIDALHRFYVAGNRFIYLQKCVCISTQISSSQNFGSALLRLENSTNLIELAASFVEQSVRYDVTLYVHQSQNKYTGFVWHCEYSWPMFATNVLLPLVTNTYVINGIQCYIKDIPMAWTSTDADNFEADNFEDVIQIHVVDDEE